MKICPYCNAEVEDDSIFCCMCGSNLENDIQNEYQANEDVVIDEESYSSNIDEEIPENEFSDNGNDVLEYTNSDSDYDEVISADENTPSENENFQYPDIADNNYPSVNNTYPVVSSEIPTENDSTPYVKKGKGLKIALIATLCCCSVLVCCCIFFGVWHLKDLKRMEEATQATEVGDYKKAVELYSKIMPFGELKNEADKLSAVVSEAGVSFEAAETALENYDYISAMENANKAIEVCPSFKKANEIFDTAQGELGRYFQKKFDEGDYTSILSASEIKEEWRSEQVNELLRKVNDMIAQDISNGYSYLRSDSPAQALSCAKDALSIDGSNQEAVSLCDEVATYYIDKGNTYLQNGNTSSAENFANLAEEANPNNSGIETLRNDITEFKADYSKYSGYVSKARSAYDSSDIKGAYNWIKDIPNSGAGSVVINGNSSFINTIKNDYSHLNKLVSNNGCRWTTFAVGNVGAAIVNVELKNNISRSVGVQVRFYFNGAEHYSTFTLSGNSSKTFTCNFNNVRIYGNNNNCTAKVTDSWIE